VTQGVGKGFEPGVAAANKALGNIVKKDAHPAGVEGTRYSLNKMSELIREGRNDPRMRGWAGRTLIAAGKPTSVKGQVQALLNELRKKTVYVQDPINTEMMAKPHVTLCLDDHGLCMPAADCDDRCIALASATMSIGLETKIVGCAYGTPQATHVICAVYDPELPGWLKLDPSHPTWPVGEVHSSTKEWWVDPISGSTSMSADGQKTSLGKEPENGDYIGVGAVPFAHAFSPITHGASYVPVGLESGMPCCPDGTECGTDETVVVEFGPPFHHRPLRSPGQ